MKLLTFAALLAISTAVHLEADLEADLEVEERMITLPLYVLQNRINCWNRISDFIDSRDMGGDTLEEFNTSMDNCARIFENARKDIA